jgi:predicted TIM-barrel fold metal-dependent hydrolase
VPLGVDRWSTRLEVHAFTHPVGQMAATMAFTVGGILHRFPKLRVAFLEANTGWLPFWLERIDEHWELTPEQAPKIDRKPSEYFLSGRCFIGMDPEEPDVPWVVKRLGEDVVVYASDYYHWDCAFPDTVKIVAERDDLSSSAKKKILETNPQRLYKL